jgi:hypothetical protein
LGHDIGPAMPARRMVSLITRQAVTRCSRQRLV